MIPESMWPGMFQAEAGRGNTAKEAWGRILTFVLNDRARKTATRWTSAADGASIILNASVAGSTAPSPEWSVYNATKAAVRSFARTWTTDLKDRRIRVNAVSPAFIDTPPWHSTEAGEKHMKMISNSIPFGRFGTPDEVARAVVFLASDDSSYITGTELFVDGGFAQV